MLNPATLNRVSNSYRRGYLAGHAQEPCQNEPVVRTESNIPMKPFSDHDYEEGYKAGLNDRYWSDFRAGSITEARKDFMAKFGVTVK